MAGSRRVPIADFDPIFAGTSPLDVAITTRQVAETIDLPLTPSQRAALLVAAKAVELHYPINLGALEKLALGDTAIRILVEKAGLKVKSASDLEKVRRLLLVAAATAKGVAP